MASPESARGQARSGPHIADNVRLDPATRQTARGPLAVLLYDWSSSADSRRQRSSSSLHVGYSSPGIRRV